MNDQTNKLLEDLAAKLGTTVEYLWTVLLSQAQIDAWFNVVQYVIFIVSGVFLWKLHKRFSKEDAHGDNAYERNIGTGIITGSLVMVWVTVLVVAFFSIPSAFNGFLNPEYWALERIMLLKNQ